MLEDEKDRPSPGEAPAADGPGHTASTSSPGPRTDPGSVEPAAAEPLAPPAAWTEPSAKQERYELLELLGQGGMGSVHKARDRQLNRFVAIKFLHTERPSAVQRFTQEAHAQARINHENVCKIYEVGEQGGRPYIAMEFIDGLPLHKAMPTPGLEEKLCLIRDAAEALHAAHRLGIVHRDVKPSNILTQRRNDGTWRAVIMDFGLAHDPEAKQALTRSGAVMGTPAYMSPEQARGDARSVDRRSDVYSLGATLFELLTDRPPFDGDSPAEVLLKTLTEEPPALRVVCPGLPLDLETIVMKCLHKDPEQRYVSARALAEDLQRYLNGDPILGRRSSILYRLQRKIQKNRSVVAGALVALVCLLALGVYGIQARLAVRREQAQTAARARLSQSLGQHIKEMEWFMRSVHQLPLHETRYANAAMQARMNKLLAQQHGLGEAGDGLVEYALGHGYFALKDYDQAYTHLAAAQRKGSDTPELRWTLGRVLGEQYKKRLEDVLRTGDVSFVKARKEELRTQYLKPAVKLLQDSRGVELASQKLLEALLALYGEDYDEALKKADEAVLQAPWLYEARQLLGDAHFALGIDRRSETKYAAAKQHFERAIEKYQQAAESGRSDAQIYEAIAEAYLQWADIATNLEQDVTQITLFEQANLSCEKATIASPDRPHCYSKITRGLAGVIWLDILRQKPFDDNLKKITQYAKQGLALDPDDAYIYDSLGATYHFMANSLSNHGKDPTDYYRISFEYFNKALEKQPKFPVSQTNFGYAYLEKAIEGFNKLGQIPYEEFEFSIKQFKTASVIDPSYEPAWIDLLNAYFYLIQSLSQSGKDASNYVREATREIHEVLSLKITVANSLFIICDAYQHYIEYLLQKGDIVGLEKMLETERAVAEHAERTRPPDDIDLLRMRISMAVDEARIRLAKAQDPTPAIVAGRAALAKSQDHNATNSAFPAEGLRLASLLSEVAADWAPKRGLPSTPHLEQAAAEARRAVALLPDSDHQIQLVRILLRLTAVQPARPLPPLLAEGLRTIKETLSSAPGLSEPHALHGELLLLQCKTAATAKARLALVEQARDALAEAVKRNPLAARVHERAIAQASLLVAQLSPKPLR